MEDKQYITIELEEYKELLIIKGKYEQLASSIPTYAYPKITWNGFQPGVRGYEATCDTGYKEIDPGFYTAGYCQVDEKTTDPYQGLALPEDKFEVQEG